LEIEIRDITPEDQRALLNDMRSADRAEVEATTPLSLESAVRQTVSLSTDSRVGLIDGKVAALWGAAPISLSNAHGAPWMLATTVIEKHPLAFLRRCKEQFSAVHGPYQLLENHVDVRNRVAIHWLRWLGFEFDDPTPWGWKGLPFHRFSMRTN
jgi:hypothetical protein